MIPIYKELFGSAVAEQCLLYIANYREAHISGIAHSFDLHPAQVGVQLRKLESGGILVARTVGNMRIFTFNPRLAIKDELESLLLRIIEVLPESDIEAHFRERRRPRRTGKAM